jgi:hypothetical protein
MRARDRFAAASAAQMLDARYTDCFFYQVFIDLHYFPEVAVAAFPLQHFGW